MLSGGQRASRFRRETEMAMSEMWNTLLEMGVEEQTLDIVTDINGYSKETLEDVLYAFSGYRSFDQL